MRLGDSQNCILLGCIRPSPSIGCVWWYRPCSLFGLGKNTRAIVFSITCSFLEAWHGGLNTPSHLLLSLIEEEVGLVGGFSFRRMECGRVALSRVLRLISSRVVEFDY